MNLQQILSSDIALRLGWTVLHSLWQGAATALLLAAVLGALRSRSTQPRYFAALSSLGMLLTAVVVTFCVIPSGRSFHDTTVIDDARSPAFVLAAPASAPLVGAAAVPVPMDAPPPSLPVQTWSSRCRGYLDVIVPWAACGWGLGVLALSLWHMGGWIAVQRLRKVGVQPVDASISDLAARIARRLNVRGVVRIVQSVRVETPLVVGWLRPLILLPAAILMGLTAQQLEAILAHELAHVRRHDYLVNLVQVAAETLLFYHPAVWWISRRIRLEREQCCDDIAVSICGDRCRYVESLAALEEMRIGGSMALAATGSGGSELMIRIRRLLSPAQDSGRRHAGAAIMAGVLIVVASTIVACMHHRQPSENTTDAMTVEKLVEHLRLAEQPFKNLTVRDFELTEEFRPQGSNIWQKTPFRIAGTAYYGDPATSAVRLDISQAILSDGVNWFEMAFSIGYDGSSGRYVQYKFGDVGQPQDLVVVATFPSEPDVGFGGYLRDQASGVYFSTQFKSGYQLSQSIQRLMKRGQPGHIERVELDGREVFRYSYVWGNPAKHTGTVWFDPQYNYFPVAGESIRDKIIDSRTRHPEMSFTDQKGVKVADSDVVNLYSAKTQAMLAQATAVAQYNTADTLMSENDVAQLEEYATKLGFRSPDLTDAIATTRKNIESAQVQLQLYKGNALSQNPMVQRLKAIIVEETAALQIQTAKFVEEFMQNLKRAVAETDAQVKALDDEIKESEYKASHVNALDGELQRLSNDPGPEEKASRVTESHRVTRLTEAAPGLWYPVTAVREFVNDVSQPSGIYRYSYRAKKVVANDPAFDPKMLTIPMPPGYSVPPPRESIVVTSRVQFTLPASQPAQIKAVRSKSIANLKQYGLATMMYWGETNGFYPPDMATLMKTVGPPEALKSPMGDEKNGYDYVYVHYKGMREPLPGDLVLMYDAPDAAKTGGASVLFTDGHVEWLDAAALKSALERSEKQRLRG